MKDGAGNRTLERTPGWGLSLLLPAAAALVLPLIALSLWSDDGAAIHGVPASRGLLVAPTAPTNRGGGGPRASTESSSLRFGTESIGSAKAAGGSATRVNTAPARIALAAPSASSAPVADAAPRSASPSRRQRTLWQEQAFCGRTSPKKLGEWAAYLRRFRSVPLPTAVVYADPAVPAQVTSRLEHAVHMARSSVREAIGLDAPPPTVYVHRDVTTLREQACVGAGAVAFYDGAIHLPDRSAEKLGTLETWRSLLHEYTHHALLTNDMGEPIWFQEGLAMHVSGERFPSVDLSEPSINLRDMVDGFPHTAPAEFAQRFYAQAYLMVAFLEGLCGQQVGCGKRSFVAQAREAGTAPSVLFDSLIAELAPNSQVSSEALWQMYRTGLVQ